MKAKAEIAQGPKEYAQFRDVPRTVLSVPKNAVLYPFKKVTGKAKRPVAPKTEPALHLPRSWRFTPWHTAPDSFLPGDNTPSACQ